MRRAVLLSCTAIVSLGALAQIGPADAQSYYFRWRAEGVTSTSDPYAAPTAETVGQNGGQTALAVSTVVAAPTSVKQGDTVSAQFAAQGGQAPITWRLENAPAGMVINADGVLSWLADSPGTYPGIVAVAADAGGAEARSSAFDLQVVALTSSAKLFDKFAQADQYFGQSLSVRSGQVAVGSPWDDEGGVAEAGSVSIFAKTSNGWEWQAKLTDPSTKEYQDFFGESVALGDGELAVATLSDTVEGVRKGSVRIFTGSGSSWTSTVVLSDPGGRANDNFGRSMRIRGGVLAVGAPQVDSTNMADHGSVVVFEKVDGTWKYAAKLLDTTRVASDFLGYAVAIGDGWIAAGGYGRDESGLADVGTVAIFRRTATAWEYAYSIPNPEKIAGSFFGHTLAEVGGRLAVFSMPSVGGVSRPGRVAFFDVGPTAAAHVGTLDNPEPAGNARFGYSLAAQGGALVVGTPGDVRDGVVQGSASVFNLVDGQWKRTAKLWDGLAQANVEFGRVVAADVGVIGVSAPYYSQPNLAATGSVDVVE